jgi:hypothetical protein
MSDDKCEPGCIHERDFERYKTECRAHGVSESAISLLSAHPWRITDSQADEARSQLHRIGGNVRQGGQP